MRLFTFNPYFTSGYYSRWTDYLKEINYKINSLTHYKDLHNPNWYVLNEKIGTQQFLSTNELVDNKVLRVVYFTKSQSFSYVLSINRLRAHCGLIQSYGNNCYYCLQDDFLGSTTEVEKDSIPYEMYKKYGYNFELGTPYYWTCTSTSHLIPAQQGMVIFCNAIEENSPYDINGASHTKMSSYIQVPYSTASDYYIPIDTQTKDDGIYWIWTYSGNAVGLYGTNYPISYPCGVGRWVLDSKAYNYTGLQSITLTKGDSVVIPSYNVTQGTIKPYVAAFHKNENNDYEISSTLLWDGNQKLFSQFLCDTTPDKTTPTLTEIVFDESQVNFSKTKFANYMIPFYTINVNTDCNLKVYINIIQGVLMAEFTISLLTPRLYGTEERLSITNKLDGTTQYLTSTLSHFETPVNADLNNVLTAITSAPIKTDDSFCYTYNEKYSQHQNAQKELTFSMNRRILQHDEWLTNPYVSALHIGSIIELVDKYQNHILFIITKISYEFKQINIVYNYTCQDAFSYQYTRQQSGYTIENDASKDTFIGPKTIDYWAQKIVNECNISYTYIPLAQGYVKTITTAVDETNVSFDSFTTTSRENWGNDSNIERIILKEPFIDKDYNTPIVFSCSGSNADAALISLGDNYDLMLHTCEIPSGANDGSYRLFFWFEPKKNQDVTGLKYSPNREISKFNLDFDGTSLTTVLNVDSHKVGDDVVSLLPSLPAVFANLFMSPEWNKTIFHPHFFSNYIEGISYQYNDISTNNSNLSVGAGTLLSGTLTELDNQGLRNFEVSESGTSKFVVIPISTVENSLFYFNPVYNYFTDNLDETHQTMFSVIYDSTSQSFLARKNSLYLIVEKDMIDSDGKTVTSLLDTDEKPLMGTAANYYVIAENTEFPKQLLGKYANVYLAVPVNSSASGNISISNLQIYLQLKRNFTDEEKEFAAIADECPWLENKLIDFNYFVRNSIISRSEYTQLMDLLQNKLRIVNGHLLYLTDAYYRALSTRVSEISNLTNKLDNLCAEFHAAVVSPVKSGITPKDAQVQSFRGTYNEIFGNLSKDNLIYILNYPELVSDYFKKYMSAQQRFLKNIYAFRQYFTSPCGFSYNKNSGVYTDTLTLTDDTSSNEFISFHQPTFAGLDKSMEITNPNMKIYVYDANVKKYTLVDFVNKDNYSKYYTPTIAKNSFNVLDSKDESQKSLFDYNSKNKYWLEINTYNNVFKTAARSDLKKYTDNHGETFCELTTDELKRLYLYYHVDDYYYRKPSSYVKFNDIRTTKEELFKYISPLALPNFLSYRTYNSNSKDNYDLPMIFNDKVGYYVYYDSNDKNSARAWEFYKAFLPLDTIYYKGPVITLTENTSDMGDSSTTYTLTRYNEKNQPDNTTNYETYQPMPFAGGGSMMLQDWVGFNNDAGQLKETELRQNWNYAALHLNPDTGQRAVAGVLYTWLGSLGVLGWAAIAIHAVASHYLNESWCQWETTLEADRSFESNATSINVWNEHCGDDDETHAFSTYDSYHANYAVSTSACEESQKMLSIWLQAGADKINGFNINTEDDNSENPVINDKIKNKVSDVGKVNTDNFNKNSDVVYNRYQYFNFYKYIVPTYSFQGLSNQKNSLYVVDTKLRFLKKDDYINKYDDYLVIPASQPFSLEDKDKKQIQYIKDDFLAIVNNNPLVSALKWYPLKHLGVAVNAQNVDFKDKKRIAIKDLFESKATDVTMTWDETGYLCSVNDTKDAIQGKYYFAHVEDYERGLYTKDNIGNASIDAIYSIDSDNKVNLLKISNFIGNIAAKVGENNFAVTSGADSGFKVIDSFDVNTTICYEKKNEDTYERIYTREQIQNTLANTTADATKYCAQDVVNKLRTFSSSTYKEVNFTTTTKFTPTLYLCKLEEIDGKYSITSTKHQLDKPLDFSKNTTVTVSINNRKYQITLKEEKDESLNNITNGTFWYRYHTRTDYQPLFEFAASIETQLETYWQQAYTASKYCEFFLPQYWQPRGGDSENAFADEIFQVEKNGSVITDVKLDDKYLPLVSIYHDAGNNHYLPKYDWSYSSDTEQFVLMPDETQSAISLPSITNNEALNQIINHLNQTFNNWNVVENGKTVYYIRDGGGTTWNEFAYESTKGTAGEFSHFGGLYDMMFYIITHAYTDRSFSEYQKAKEDQRAVWQQIYRDYPFLLLENNYSYENATTSQELLDMAKLVFKGKKEPERNYSISIIDIHSLLGYKGEELKPGQGIQLLGQDYYDENDDIATALSQYLFITDLNYNLRSDTDMNITVNAIKYQEKVLQSLVKLIR